MNNKIYNVAIIGCGNIGAGFDQSPDAGTSNSHLGAYTHHTRTKVVAVCDANESRLKEISGLWDIPQIYTSVDEMMANESIDIVSVCTPAETHLSVIQKLVQYPLTAIYCEKPLAETSENARIIEKLCRENNMMLMVNHQRRFAPFYQELKERIGSGQMGGIQQVRCLYTRGIMNTGVHMLNLFLYLFGEDFEVCGSVFSRNQSPWPHDPNIDALIQIKNGPMISLQACDDQNYLILEVDILGSLERIQFGQDVQSFVRKQLPNLLDKYILSANSENPIQSSYGPIPLTLGVDHLLDSIEKTKQPLSSGQDSVATIQLIEELKEKAKCQN